MDDLACTKCHIAKPMESFHCDKSSINGHVTQCKECRKVARRDWYVRNEESQKPSGRSIAKAKLASYPCENTVTWSSTE